MAVDWQADAGDLDVWFSPERMEVYERAAEERGVSAVDLYVWDTRLSKAFLEDIAHVEVLLRNFIDVRLAADCGHADWYHDETRFGFTSRRSDRFARSVTDVERRLRREGRDPTLGRVVAGMTLGVWCFLLSRRLEHSVWRAIVSPANGGVPFYPSRSRVDFETHAQSMLALRNRCSHHEHVIIPDPDAQAAMIESNEAGILWLARVIDPHAAAWVDHNSRVRMVADTVANLPAA